ncbi:hypothetical protein DF185_22635 [Marinifilum breve]|uniref:Uncharacterized protein n=2 Tax=Marinifilum breve TaxID=2184082 RepID=A0A2V3ZRL6_9BACT|nr:hypothetical protein DF185_22635 [Marinifilum breve]
MSIQTSKKKYLIYSIIGMVLFAFGCKKKLTREELISYLNEPMNGLVKEKVINGVDIQLQVKHPDLYVDQHLKAFPDSLRETKLYELKKQYEENLYLQLSLGINNNEILKALVNTPQYTTMVNRLSFGMRDFVVLTTNNKDTLLLKSCTYVPTYGMAKHNSVLFVFDEQKIAQAESLKFRIKEMGLETGEVSFKLKTKDIKSIPNLNFNK